MQTTAKLHHYTQTVTRCSDLSSTLRRLAYHFSIKLIPATLDDNEMVSAATEITRTVV